MKVGQLKRSVAPVGSLGPGSKEFRKWATGLKTGPRTGAPQGCPFPTLWSMWGQPKFIPFHGETLAYTVVSYSSSSWEIPTLRYCRRGVVGEEYSSARMVFRSRRSIK